MYNPLRDIFSELGESNYWSTRLFDKNEHIYETLNEHKQYNFIFGLKQDWEQDKLDS